MNTFLAAGIGIDNDKRYPIFRDRDGYETFATIGRQFCLSSRMISLYLGDARDGDGHALAGVDPGRLDDERHGGEGDALHHLDAGAHDGAPAHQHVRPVPVEDPRDDQRLVRAARHHADVETHLDGFSVRMSQLASCRQGLGVFSTTATSLFRSSDLNDCCCQGGNMDEQILPTRRYSSHFYDLFQPIVVKI